ncbi:jg9743 [Pararge aegeria aegeria]|uniref:Jg9743 protein n=1 Tax=Pararge aegeria aegeria TaxID=348720 RepID=A0A8S4QYJ4_9NEOP|nr:jg9743 [Pararge aegeria aegeria]
MALLCALQEQAIYQGGRRMYRPVPYIYDGTIFPRIPSTSPPTPITSVAPPTLDYVTVPGAVEVHLVSPAAFSGTRKPQARAVQNWEAIQLTGSFAHDL